MVSKIKRPRGIHPINYDAYHRYNTFIVTAEGIEEEAEIEVNATRNGQDGENDNQMGQLLEPEGDLKKERGMLLRILNFQRSKLASFFIGFKSTNLLAFKGIVQQNNTCGFSQCRQVDY